MDVNRAAELARAGRLGLFFGIKAPEWNGPVVYNRAKQISQFQVINKTTVTRDDRSLVIKLSGETWGEEGTVYGLFVGPGSRYTGSGFVPRPNGTAGHRVAEIDALGRAADLALEIIAREPRLKTVYLVSDSDWLHRTITVRVPRWIKKTLNYFGAGQGVFDAFFRLQAVFRALGDRANPVTMILVNEEHNLRAWELADNAGLGDESGDQPVGMSVNEACLSLLYATIAFLEDDDNFEGNTWAESDWTLNSVVHHGQLGICTAFNVWIYLCLGEERAGLEYQIVLGIETKQIVFCADLDSTASHRRYPMAQSYADEALFVQARVRCPQALSRFCPTVPDVRQEWCMPEIGGVLSDYRPLIGVGNAWRSEPCNEASFASCNQVLRSAEGVSELPQTRPHIQVVMQPGPQPTTGSRSTTWAKMDPVSALSLAKEASSIVKLVMQYCLDAKGASNDIQMLNAELFALEGILGHVKSQRTAAASSSTPSRDQELGSQVARYCYTAVRKGDHELPGE
ncbi:hypothetical protein B0H66DRAFT_590660 [Apodospora peruviana]|uniref:Uncharacterized protein n=1 Tax=Apodospora peruviana TaxID=516989 RepID=A0AAE0M8C2_9PEZI|nr:hypothetical protein B0H66DRAFT_590660 [Apodospora peruviana]